MSFNFVGAKQVPLSVFGGTVSEMAAPNLPEGVSPDCQDVVFVPGGVASRPALQKVYGTPFPQNSGPYVPTVVSAHEFVTPGGVIYNLYLDSNGTIWSQNVISGARVNLGTTFGTFMKAITAFSRAYMAFSDGLAGQDVALQWDGTNLDRVTQDGPGAAPSVAMFSLPSVTM